MVSEKVKAFRARMRVEEEERQAFKRKMEAKYARTWGQKTRKSVWNLAWEEGHSSGFSGVEQYYQELAEIVNGALKELKDEMEEQQYLYEVAEAEHAGV